MRTLSRVALQTIALLCVLAAVARAYERPNAVSLSGEGWEVAPTAPLIDVVQNRDDRCDWPTLDPKLEKVLPADLMSGDTGTALAKYMNRGIIALQWKPIAVPCAWEQALGIDYNQAGWYRKHFTGTTLDSSGAGMPARDMVSRPGTAAPLKRTWLEFDAVSTVAGVWLNGHWLGGHVGDYTRWRVEATDAILPGQNELIVYVDELPDHLTQGFLSMICPHHGGIWQDLRIYTSGELSIRPDGVSIRTDAAGQVTIDIRYEGKAAGEVMPVIIWAESFPNDISSQARIPPDKFEVLSSEAGHLVCRKKVAAKQWTLSAPLIYRADIYLKDTGLGDQLKDTFWEMADSVSQTFAFRDIHVEGSKFMLNGQPLYIRSALNWGYYPRIVAPCPPPDVVREEFRQLKAAGFNAETVCLVNMPDYFYDIADEMGVLLWQEYPSWHCTFAEKDRASYERQYERFFARDRNHPSIILRSLSVEAGVEDQAVMNDLYAMAKDMTDTPVQDNNSWFSHSNPATTDWYGEDNYFNNPQWERHLMGRLPKQLDALPAKPYLIGESILFNTWPDTAALEDSLFAKHVQLERGPTVRYSGAGDREEDTDHRSALQSTDWQPTMAWIKGPGPWGLSGTDEPSKLAEIAPQGGPGYGEPGGGWPYWFPRCMDSVLATEEKLRARYNSELPEGQDIIRDYLLPQSYDYAMQSRRFQIELIHADPRYAGYTVNCIRDMPLIRAGLLDDLGRPRWTPEQWSWHNDATDSPVHVGDYDPAERKPGEPGKLDHVLSAAPRSAKPSCYVLEGGYSDPSPDLGSVAYQLLSEADLRTLPARNEGRPKQMGDEGINVVVGTVLTHSLVDFASRGGAVLLLASKWPGAFSTEAHMHWRDSVLAPPVGPLSPGLDPNMSSYAFTSSDLLRLQCYNLIRDYSQVIPVDQLGITHELDPLLRLYDTHDLDQVVVFDQLSGLRVVGSDIADSGLFIVSSLDHSGAAGQELLARLIDFAGRDTKAYRVLDQAAGRYSDGGYAAYQAAMWPRTAVNADKLNEFAVNRANGIVPLDEGWRFKLDPKHEGEAAGWMNSDYDDSSWEARTLPAWWEQWGIDYDGMAWYRTTVDAPADWNGATIRLICDGVDDGYVVWVNGQRVELHGSFTDHEATVFQKQTVTDISKYMRPGGKNTIALQVVDIVGNGGIWRPVYITAD